MTTRSSPRRRAGLRTTRDELLHALTDILDGAGARWAWQGGSGAADTWRASTSSDDLDVWCDEDGADVVAASIDAWPAARIADARDPRRLRHVSHAVETEHGLAIVDVTYGDLRVGAVLLVPAADIAVRDGRLVGVAGAADRLLRRLLRGRLPDDSRLEEARAAWAEASARARSEAQDLWSEQLGTDLVDEVVAVLDGATPDPELPSRVRGQLLRRTLAPAGVRAAWSQRNSVVPAGRAAGPLGLRTRGVVVVLVGTDGSGKSTVSDELTRRLELCGFSVRQAYFGMARGNLPGVGLARRLLGVAPAGDGHEDASAAAGPLVTSEGSLSPDVEDASSDPVETNDASALSHPGLRRAAAWYYAAEYAWRYASTVSPSVRRRRVVVCDRYVYDLRESPWPGSLASRVVEAVVPAPDVLVLPDAPIELIHARKPERSLADQAGQQSRFRALLESRPARVAEVRVDTSGAADDGVADVVAAVVTAAHRSRRHGR